MQVVLNEQSEKFAQWNRLAAVIQMERVDHNKMSG